MSCQDEDLVTEARLAKGDLLVVKNWRGRVIHAIPKNLTIIKELIRRRVFPHHYEVYGIGFMELRNAFRAPWAVRSSAVLMEQWGIGVSNSKATEIYQHVCRELGNRRIDIIEFVVEASMDRLDQRKLDLWKDSFERLIATMDEERELALRELNKY
jgi:hypothetical protein